MPETLDDYVKNNTKVTAKNPTPHYTAAKPYQNCSAGVDHAALEAKINEECDGKLNCTLSLANSAVYTQDFIDANNKKEDHGAAEADEGAGEDLF